MDVSLSSMHLEVLEVFHSIHEGKGPAIILQFSSVYVKRVEGLDPTFGFSGIGFSLLLGNTLRANGSDVLRRNIRRSGTYLKRLDSYPMRPLVVRRNVFSKYT